MNRILHAALAALLLVPAQACAEDTAANAARGEIRFEVKQMGVTVSGRFKRFSAEVAFDPANLESSKASVTVDVSSIDTGDDEADQTALDTPWLDASGFPQATFRSSGIRALGDGKYEAVGALTLRGKAREITVPFDVRNQPGGSMVASGQFGLRRTDFGIGGGEWNEEDIVADLVIVKFRIAMSPDAS